MNGLTKMDYPEPVNESGMIQRATIKQRLTRQQKELSERLNQVNAALDAMEKNPEAAELFELISKVV